MPNNYQIEEISEGQSPYQIEEIKPESSFLPPIDQMKGMFSSPEAINEMLGMAAGGGPGIKTVGVPVAKAAGNIIAKTGRSIGNLYTHSTKNLEPLENKVTQTLMNHEAIAGQPIAGAEKAALKQAEDEIKSHLNHGATHDVRVASRLDKIIDATKKDIGKTYDTIEEDLANKNITLKNTDDAKSLHQKLTELIKSGNTHGEEAQEILKKLDNVGKDEVIPARDYLATYRTVRDYAKEARREAYQTGITDETRQAAFKRADSLESEIEKMKPILESGIGKESSKLLSEANHRWATEVVPIQKNNLYGKIKYEGRLPTNIMKELRGSGHGMKEIREIIKSDPELLQNVVGQRFAHAPGKLQGIGELESEYVEQMPELKKLIQNHVGAQQNLEKGIADHASRKNISLMEKMQAERELSKMRELQKKARTKLLIGATGLIGGKGVNSLTKLLSNNDSGE